MSTDVGRSGFVVAPQPSPVVAIIPARFDSSRFPGKPLADLCGRPMIAHVYERVRQAKGIDTIIVATDDTRIADAVASFGGTVCMTSAHHRTGTDRVAEVAAGLTCGIVVNIQGDEPLLAPETIEDVIRPLQEDATLPMATVRRESTDPREYGDPNVVKVVVNAAGDAMYFSRASIPGAPAHSAGVARCYAHIGLYAYRREFLLTFAALPQSPLEQTESLEQLRALEHGYRIRTVPSTRALVGVDTPEDLDRARQLLRASPREVA